MLPPAASVSPPTVFTVASLLLPKPGITYPVAVLIGSGPSVALPFGNRWALDAAPPPVPVPQKSPARVGDGGAAVAA